MSESYFQAEYVAAENHPLFRPGTPAWVRHEDPRRLVRQLRLYGEQGQVNRVLRLQGCDVESERWLADIAAVRHEVARVAHDNQLCGVVVCVSRNEGSLVLEYSDGRRIGIEGWDGSDDQVRVFVVDASAEQA